jgi:hypothetical protein
MTAQLAATGRVVLFEGFKEHMLPFLDITPLMPPERLRWSRLLKRPLMDQATPGSKTVSSVFIDEVLPHPDCEVYGYYEDDIVEPGLVEDLPVDLRVRSSFYWVFIRSELDTEFTVAWRATHGQDWPFIAEMTPHPALLNLHQRYLQFWCSWCDHGAALSEAFDERLVAAGIPTITYYMGPNGGYEDVEEETTTADEAADA